MMTKKRHNNYVFDAILVDGAFFLKASLHAVKKKLVVGGGHSHPHWQTPLSLYGVKEALYHGLAQLKNNVGVLAALSKQCKVRVSKRVHLQDLDSWPAVAF